MFQKSSDFTSELLVDMRLVVVKTQLLLILKDELVDSVRPADL